MTTTTQVGHGLATQFSLGTFNHAGLEKLTQAFQIRELMLIILALSAIYQRVVCYTNAPYGCLTFCRRQLLPDE